MIRHLLNNPTCGDQRSGSPKLWLLMLWGPQVLHHLISPHLSRNVFLTEKTFRSLVHFPIPLRSGHAKPWKLGPSPRSACGEIKNVIGQVSAKEDSLPPRVPETKTGLEIQVNSPGPLRPIGQSCRKCDTGHEPQVVYLKRPPSLQKSLVHSVNHIVPFTYSYSAAFTATTEFASGLSGI
jgi:hypothetical protein